MNITCNRKALLNACQLASLVVPARTPKAILKSIKIDAGEQCMLEATDLEIAVCIQVPGVTCESAGKCLVPATHFAEILKELDADRVNVAAGDGLVTVSSERSEFRLQVPDADEFPALPDTMNHEHDAIASAALVQLAHRTIFAAGVTISRYATQGVLFECDGLRMVAVATDGRRLAKAECQAIGGSGSHDVRSVIVPERAVKVMAQLVAAKEGEARFSMLPNEVVVQTPVAMMRARLLEGRFPDWKGVIPGKRDSLRASIPAGLLYSAMRQAAITAGDGSSGIVLQFADDELVVSSRTAEVGESRIVLPVACDGLSCIARFNYRYLFEFFDAVPSESVVTVDVQDGETAATFSLDDGYTYTIMPSGGAEAPAWRRSVHDNEQR